MALSPPLPVSRVGFFAAICVFYLTGYAADATTPTGETLVSFKRDVAPVLLKRCQGCHGPEKTKGGYRLDTFDRLAQPGSSATAAVKPGDPAHSELYRLLTTDDEDERMPKKGDRLPDGQLAAVRRWIAQGAKFDGPDPAAALSSFVETEHPRAPDVYRFPVPAAAVAFSPDGGELAVGGYHEITLWAPADGHPLGRIPNVARQTQGLAYSPDGKFLAAASGTPGEVGEVRLFDAAGRSLVKVLDRITDSMLAVRFSPDGKRLAAGGADNAIRLYDLPAGTRRLVIEQHADWVTDLAFSPDGGHLASASRDKSCRVFDVNTGAMEAAYLGHEEPVYAVAWADGGKLIYSAGHDKKIHAWRPADAKADDAKAVAKIAGFDGDVFRLATGAGFLFACSADGTLRQYAADKRDLVRTYPPAADWVYGLAVDEPRRRLVSGGFDGKVRVFNLDDGAAVSAFVAAPGYEKGK